MKTYREVTRKKEGKRLRGIRRIAFRKNIKIKVSRMICVNVCMVLSLK
jgi:hypothetical protein